MKKLVDGLDLSRAGFRPPMYALEHLDYEASLQKALEAALSVIDAWKKMAEVEGVTNGGIRHCLEKSAELETALEPFKKGG